LRDEKIESFIYLFNNFLTAMGSHRPKTIIMGQHPAIKQAIIDVFYMSIHRFYMWHIKRKLHEKVIRMLNDYEDFVKHIKGCVWALDSPDKFEKF